MSNKRPRYSPPCHVSTTSTTDIASIPITQREILTLSPLRNCVREDAVRLIRRFYYRFCKANTIFSLCRCMIRVGFNEHFLSSITFEQLVNFLSQTQVIRVFTFFSQRLSFVHIFTKYMNSCSDQVNTLSLLNSFLIARFPQRILAEYMKQGSEDYHMYNTCVCMVQLIEICLNHFGVNGKHYCYLGEALNFGKDWNRLVVFDMWNTCRGYNIIRLVAIMRRHMDFYFHFCSTTCVTHAETKNDIMNTLVRFKEKLFEIYGSSIGELIMKDFMDKYNGGKSFDTFEIENPIKMDGGEEIQWKSELSLNKKELIHEMLVHQLFCYKHSDSKCNDLEYTVLYPEYDKFFLDLMMLGDVSMDYLSKLPYGSFFDKVWMLMTTLGGEAVGREIHRVVETHDIKGMIQSGTLNLEKSIAYFYQIQHLLEMIQLPVHVEDTRRLWDAFMVYARKRGESEIWNVFLRYLKYICERIHVIKTTQLNEGIVRIYPVIKQHGIDWSKQKAFNDVENGTLVFTMTTLWLHEMATSYLMGRSLEDLHHCIGCENRLKNIHQDFSLGMLFGRIDIFRKWPEIYRFDRRRCYGFWYLCEVISKIAVILLTCIQVSKKETKQEITDIFEKELGMIVSRYSIDYRIWVEHALKISRNFIAQHNPNSLGGFNLLVHARLDNEDDKLFNFIKLRLSGVARAIMHDQDYHFISGEIQLFTTALLGYFKHRMLVMNDVMKICFLIHGDKFADIFKEVSDEITVKYRSKQCATNASTTTALVSVSNFVMK